MRSLLGRFHRPFARSADEQLLLMNNLGDGSTLSLDFTTMGNTLDPRLTFTRSTNATFINSQGYVEWAAANIITYSEAQDNNAYWNAYGTAVTRTAGKSDPLGGTGAVELTFDATSTDAVISRAVAVSQGIQYTLSIWIRAVSGTLSNVRIARAATPTGAFFPVLTTAWQRFQLTFVASSASDGIEIRVLNSGSPKTATFQVFGGQLEPGSVMRDYRATTANAYQAPRFDYDPTSIGTPRGLLIEGSAVNLALRSDDFNTTVTDGTQWNASGYTAGTLSTTLPDGTTGNARRLSIASGAGSFRSSTITVLASTAYTFSFWARNNGGSQARFRVWNVTAGSSIVDYTQSANNYVAQIGGANNTSSTWVRVSVSFTTPVGCTSIWVYPASSDSGTVDLLVWGAQVEAGSGASSYIPTVASTGNRDADSITCTGANFSSWYQNATESSVLVESIVDQDATGFRRVFALTSSSNTTSGFPNWSGIVAGAVSSRPSINANITANNQVDAYLALAAAVSNGQIFRLAFAAKAGDYRVSRVVSGTTYASTSTYNGYPANIGVAAGSGLYFVSDGAYFRALWLRAFKFYPFRITNAQMDSWAI